MSAVDILLAATPATRTVTTCVDGALQAEWDAVNEELLTVANRPDLTGSLAKTSAEEIADRLDEIRDRVLAARVTFLFERMGPWEEIALRAEHPPRKDSAVDQFRGCNIETYYPALIRGSCVSVANPGGEPESVPEAAWVNLLGKPAEGKKSAVRGSLNTKQVNDLMAAAEQVNGGETAVPPSARSLLGNRDFGASLAQPSPGTSAPSGSEDGNPRGSRKSSTKKKASTPDESPAT